MKKIVSIIVLSALVMSTYAAQVTGKVIDYGTKQPIDFANVSVLKSNEQAPIGGTITDAAGGFSLELKDGQYTVVVSFMGYSE